jgi:hypothetical protein
MTGRFGVVKAKTELIENQNRNSVPKKLDGQIETLPARKKESLRRRPHIKETNKIKP